jgi:glucose-6-phosphate 1-dehydrogenase
MVIFGASGDLTRRKLMPALFRLEREGLLNEGLKVVGFGRSARTDESFRREVVEALTGSAGAEAEAVSRLAERASYVTGTYDEGDSLAALRGKLRAIREGGEETDELYYLAVPPTVAASTLRCMRETGFVPGPRDERRARIMMEKPFGLDLASAGELNRLLAGLFDEASVYRIDHYLAKDTVRSLLILRFANAVFEPLWDRRYVDHVQLTAAEEIGLEGRASYYEEAGVVRDMVQNHVMQVLALVAMEPPAAGDAESVRDRKVEVFRSLAPIGEGDFVFGRYRGYLEEPGVAPGSRTPTFAALRLRINNWRWQDVPFYVRSGKRLARKVTEVIVRFKDVPLCVVGDEEACRSIGPNSLAVRIQPDEGIRLSFNARLPGREERVRQAGMDFRYVDLGVAPAGGYEQVLLDGLEGRPSLFWRSDGVEASWRAVTPLLEAQDGGGAPLRDYEPGSWGPEEADDLVRRDGREWLSSY